MQSTGIFVMYSMNISVPFPFAFDDTTPCTVTLKGETVIIADVIKDPVTVTVKSVGVEIVLETVIGRLVERPSLSIADRENVTGHIESEGVKGPNVKFGSVYGTPRL